MSCLQIPENNIAGPDDRCDVESQQLSRLVELGMLDLGEVQLLVHLVQQVLLDDRVHNHGDEQVEEDGGDVLGALGVGEHVLEDAWLDLSWYGHIVMQGDEDGSGRAADLEHQPHHEDHGHAGNNVGMVLDDKLMAQDGGVLGLLSLDHHPGLQAPRQ